jgi:transcriptional regulator with XRE-family HTH domain
MGSSGPQKLVTVVRSGLAGDVQYVRKQQDLSLEVVCGELGWQQSKLSRMENGQQCISAADLASLLVIYKVKGRDRGELLHLVDRQDEPGRWILESPTAPTPLMRLEADATSFVSVETLLIPGLVQTAEYARALMKAEGSSPEQIEQWVEWRMRRQRVLDKAKPPTFDIILDEAVLHRPLGGHALMARQLRALLEAADRPNVRLRVVHSEVSPDAGFHQSAYVIGFARGDMVVHLESKGSATFVEDKQNIEIVQRYVANLGKAALDPAKSVDLVAKLAREHAMK